MRDRVVAMMRDMKMGDVADFRTFIGAVIDRKAFDRIASYLEDAGRNARVIEGGTVRGEDGYFVEPRSSRPGIPESRLCDEISGRS